MKKLSRRMVMGLMACVTTLVCVPGAAGKDKTPTQATATIMAIAQDGTTWVAGEAKFVVANDQMKVTVDVATGVPDATFELRAETDPRVITGIEILHKTPTTDSRGDVKTSRLFLLDPRTQETFDVRATCSVAGSSTQFVSEPVTMRPN